MNKQITAERTWQITQYEPFHLSDTISEIPEIVVKNPEAMRLLRYLQLVDLEWGYMNYRRFRAQMPLGSLEEAMEYIENERASTFAQLLDAIKTEKE